MTPAATAPASSSGTAALKAVLDEGQGMLQLALIQSMDIRRLAAATLASSDEHCGIIRILRQAWVGPFIRLMSYDEVISPS